MAEKYLNGIIDVPTGDTTELNPLAQECINSVLPAMDDTHNQNWPHLRFNIILDHVWDIIRAANNHIAQKEPWRLAKDNEDELKEVMFNVWSYLRLTAVLLYPFMPDTSEKIWKQLGLKSILKETEQSMPEKVSGESDVYPAIYGWDWKPGYDIKVSKGEQLFPRIDLKKQIKKEFKEGADIK